MTGLRQLLLVVVLSLASFAALFAAARAQREPESKAPAMPPRAEALPAASVRVADLGTAAPLPAMRARKVHKAVPSPAPAAAPVGTTPVEPAAPQPVYTPPVVSSPPPSNPSPPPSQPSNPGQSFDDSG